MVRAGSNRTLEVHTPDRRTMRQAASSDTAGARASMTSGPRTPVPSSTGITPAATTKVCSAVRADRLEINPVPSSAPRNDDSIDANGMARAPMATSTRVVVG